MKKVQLKIVVIALLFIMASCSTTQYSYRQSNIPKKDLISGEVVVDTKLDLTKKVEATSSTRNSVEEAKEEAYYKAITQNNIDVVIDPIFEIRTAGRFLVFGGKSTAKISGFGATYTNPRSKVDAINELSKVDTTNIQKFNAIYLNKYGKKREQVAESSPKSTANSDKSKATKAGWGVEIGMIASGLTVGSSTIGETSSNYSLGLFKESNFSKKLNLYGGLFYTTEGNGTKELKYVRVPIMAKYFVFKKVSVNGGLQVGYNTSFSGFTRLSDPSTIDYGILYGISYRFSNALSINYKFYKGISSVTSTVTDDIKNVNAGFSLAYHF
jgi:hypothetical protein